jgi:ABC-2 type transport system ATP-binding protein
LKEGITIFVSTAYLDEAERCSRIALIHEGKILTLDEPSAVRKSLGLPVAEVWTENARTAAELVKGFAGVKRVSIYGDKLHITLETKDVMNSVIKRLSTEGIVVKGQREILPSLEDVFISMVEK